MSYVEVCQKHGQYHGEICGDCYEGLKKENARLREALERIEAGQICHAQQCDCGSSPEEIARAALEEK